jgi:ankyrin repeat protein
MSNAQLPERASLEYLKKLAKDRLRELRRTDPRVKLATALLAVAREHGFSSWRALKAEVEQRQKTTLALFFEACAKGDVAVLRGLLGGEPSLARVSNPDARHQGWTGLHSAAQAASAETVRLLLEHGADPHAREAGDNTYPLHWAVANRDIDTVRALLDAGSDVHGLGDVHELDVIGWATFFRPPGDQENTELDASRQAIVALLVERGARHHVFSAMSVGDLDVIQKVVEENPEALDRRMSRFEEGQTPLHFAMNRKRYDMLELLIGLGADLEARDDKGLTPLTLAMLRGDRDAMRLLKAAGAEEPAPAQEPDFPRGMAAAASSIKKSAPMFSVRDMRATVRWYESIGFTVDDQYEDGGELVFAKVSFGQGEFTLTPGGNPGPRGVNLWFFSDRIQELYQLLKARQLRIAHTALDGGSSPEPDVRFDEDLYEPFYGGRQFSIQDNNGLSLVFWQPPWLT